MLRVTTLLTLLVFCTLSCKPVDKRIQSPISGNDVSDAFQTSWNSFSSNEDLDSESTALINTLSNYELIFIPGFLSDAVIDLGDFGGTRQITKLGQYFDEQIEWLKAVGVSARRLDIESEESVAINSQVIANAIRSTDKNQVLLISHSKGSIDTLETLIKVPNLRHKVHAWLSIQGAFGGSPVAEDILNDKPLSALSEALLQQLGGTQQALADLGTSLRGQSLKENAANIKELLSELPILSFTSYKENTPGWDTLLAPSRDYLLNEYGLDNDGLVAWTDAVLPGSNYIKVEGVDHAVPVMYCTFIQYDRVRFLKSTLALLLKQQSHL